MAIILSPTFTLPRKARIEYNLGGAIQLQNAGVRITSFSGPSYRRWGWLFLSNVTTVNSFSFDITTLVGPVWEASQQFRFPVLLGANKVILRSDSKLPLGATLQFYIVTP